MKNIKLDTASVIISSLIVMMILMTLPVITIKAEEKKPESKIAMYNEISDMVETLQGILNSHDNLTMVEKMTIGEGMWFLKQVHTDQVISTSESVMLHNTKD